MKQKKFQKKRAHGKLLVVCEERETEELVDLKH
jgi:hypothetical protein